MRPELDADPVHPVQLLGRRPQGAAVRRGALPRHQADGAGLSRQQQARTRAHAPRLAAPARSAGAAEAAGSPAPARSRCPNGCTTATARATTCGGSRRSALSMPSVVGPYTSVNCTLSLQSSTLRVSPLLANGVYARDTSQDDDRFVDYFGTDRRDRHQQRHQRQRHVRDQPARRALPAVRRRRRDQHLDAVAAERSCGRSTTRPSPTSSCTSATPRARPAIRSARRRPRN